MNSIKLLRAEKNLTQKQAAEIVGISLRSFKSYENDPQKAGNMKYEYILERLAEINVVDEEHGIITEAFIRQKCAEVFANYDVQFCYLFGSYAKGTAGPTSDVDLLIDANVTGLKFYGLVEELRHALKKKVDILDLQQLSNNIELTREILADGVKIYG